jgi:hypothetical protein
LSEGCEPLISRQDVPLLCYRVGCVASRSKLPRERFSPLGVDRKSLASSQIDAHDPDRTLVASPWADCLAFLTRQPVKKC